MVWWGVVVVRCGVVRCGVVRCGVALWCGEIELEEDE